MQLLGVVANAITMSKIGTFLLPQGGFGEFASSDLVGDVGAADDRTIDVELVVDHSSDQTKTTVLIMIDSLDTRDGVRVRTNVVLDLVQNSGEELKVREGREQ